MIRRSEGVGGMTDDVLKRAYAVVSAEADIRDASQALAEAAVAMLRADAKIKQGANPDARGAFILTRSGVKFHLLFPRAEDVRLEDIAGSLAAKARWNGSAQRFYSVGSHSIHVRDLVRWGFASAPEWGPFGAVPHEHEAVAKAVALLHDGHEYVLPDVPRPIKPLLLGWDAIEEGLDAAIFGAFGLAERVTPEIDAVVAWADDVALALEAAAFGPSGIMQYVQMPSLPPVGPPPEPTAQSEASLLTALLDVQRAFAPVAAEDAVEDVVESAPLNESRRSWRAVGSGEAKAPSKWESMLEGEA